MPKVCRDVSAMRIVYVGASETGSTSLSRARALEQLGHSVHLLEAFPRESRVSRLFRGARRKVGLGLPHPVNRELRRAVELYRPDIVWVDKGLHVTPATLAWCNREGGRSFRLHYAIDDLAIPGNTSSDLRRSWSEYDLAVTTKTHNLDLLRDAGARRVLMSWQGYDEERHCPPDPSERDRSLEGRILFIGAWEQERFRTIESLASAGLPLTVISHWPQWRELTRYPNFEWRPSDVYGRGYGVALGSAAVSLGFLRKQARDLHTSRSIEIPACGTVLVAERTAEHDQLFVDGREAFFFSNDAECLQVCRRLLEESTLRETVARSGRERCVTSGYSWRERMRQILAELQ